MTEKEMKRLSRKDLLEMLVTLSEENERIRINLKALEEKVNSREIIYENAGSLAEAAVEINGVLKAVQSACEQYVYNIRCKCEKMEKETKEKCDQMIIDAQRQVSENG